MALRIQNKEIVYGEKLGEGGFGEVHKAKWNHVDVAVKRLTLQKLSESTTQEFEKEITIHIDLRHPHIVQLYGIISQQPYGMVMEFMENGSLDSYLQKNPPESVSWPLKYKIALAVCKALFYLHKNGIIHRDLKSLNVLLNKSLDAKVCDFGLAKVKTETISRTQATSLKGTIQWTAPELFSRKPVYNAKTDIYSYGIVLWELASHQYPYNEVASPQIIISLVKDGEREEFPENTPKDYEDLAKKCWDGKAENRPELKNVITTLESLFALANESKQVNNYASSYLSSSTLNQNNSGYLQPTTNNNLESMGYLNPSVGHSDPFQSKQPYPDNPYPINPNPFTINNSPVIQTPQPKPIPQLPSCAFGATQWNKHFGDVGVEPPLPKDIDQILRSPCPIWSGKTVQETHLLTLIPATVNKQPFTIKTLGELIQSPKTGPATKFGYLNLREYQDNPAAQSYWILMSRDVLEGSRYETYKTQFEQVATLAKKTGIAYAAPKVLEAATCILMHHVSTGQKLYTDSPWTYTRCQEFYSQKNEQKLVVGGFGSGGLGVIFSTWDADGYCGVSVCRKF